MAKYRVQAVAEAEYIAVVEADSSAEAVTKMAALIRSRDLEPLVVGVTTKNVRIVGKPGEV